MATVSNAISVTTYPIESIDNRAPGLLKYHRQKFHDLHRMPVLRMSNAGELGLLACNVVAPISVFVTRNTPGIEGGKTSKL